MVVCGYCGIRETSDGENLGLNEGCKLKICADCFVNDQQCGECEKYQCLCDCCLERADFEVWIHCCRGDNNGGKCNVTKCEDCILEELGEKDWQPERNYQCMDCRSDV